MTTVTLGTPLDELLVESAAVSDYTKFILHYNFPPFSTGEVKMMRAPGRREVGHGNLAMRSLKKMMPGNEYLGGVAMGLITRASDGKYAILTDILGDEDHLGDMDFKVTGTRDGICGIQMDIKIDGLSMDTMREALAQARTGRLHILDAMYNCIGEARPEVKPHAPRMEKLFIDKEFIGAVIGPQGKIIQEIQRETGTTINIEEVGNYGEVSIFSPAKEGLEKAVAWVKGITAMPEVGGVYEATVKGIKEFGAFVEFLPGKQGLLHISEISWKRLESMEGVLKEGDKVKVKLIGIDHKTGKFKLSRKVLMPKPEGRKPEGNPAQQDN
jgi:polyribonucleotide nucleotidyltransferase